MYYNVIKHSGHLGTLEKCRKHSPAARVFYISLVFSNARPVLSQCNTWLRLLYLLINGQQRKKPGNDFRSFTRPAKHIFSTSDYLLHYLHCYKFWSWKHLWLKIWLESSLNPYWSLGGNNIRKTQPGCRVLFKMVPRMLNFMLFWR